jgi:putative transposase
MPRNARIVIKGYPHHIIQRGHNRQAVFISDDDYLFYIENLREWKVNLACKVYAYCLMTNHVHLVVDPGEDEKNLAQLIKRVAGRQTRYVNKLEKRTGSLWEGRYKSSTIDTNEYLLACCRYVELNPVRAGIVMDPIDYRWSSYRRKTGKQTEDWLDFDPCYMDLAGNREERAERYKGWVKETIPEGEWELIRQSLQRGQLTGSARFVDEIEQKIKKRIEIRGQGRPRNTVKEIPNY